MPGKVSALDLFGPCGIRGCGVDTRQGYLEGAESQGQVVSLSLSPISQPYTTSKAVEPPSSLYRSAMWCAFRRPVVVSPPHTPCRGWDPSLWNPKCTPGSFSTLSRLHICNLFKFTLLTLGQSASAPTGPAPPASTNYTWKDTAKNIAPVPNKSSH